MATVTDEKPKLQQPTKDFLHYLQRHPEVRTQIGARPDRTLLYAGLRFKPCYKELADMKSTMPEIRSKDLLMDVLANVSAGGSSHQNVLSYLSAVEDQAKACEPSGVDSFTLWRAVSGIYASNAIGQVSFFFGSGGAALGSETVFAVTELKVMRRNPNVDALTRDLLDYYDGCLSRPQHAVTFSFIGGASNLDEE